MFAHILPGSSIGILTRSNATLMLRAASGISHRWMSMDTMRRGVSSDIQLPVPFGIATPMDRVLGVADEVDRELVRVEPFTIDCGDVGQRPAVEHARARAQGTGRGTTREHDTTASWPVRRRFG